MGFTMRTALTATTLFLAAATEPVAEPINLLAERATMQYVACYDSKEGLTNETSFNYQSQGWCQTYCLNTNAAVFAMTGGSNCLCGEELPPTSAKVSDSKCDTKCDGWPKVMCGGTNFWSVWLTGLDSEVSSEEDASTTKSGSSPKETEQSTAVTSQPEEVTVTASAAAQTSSSPNNSSSSHNTAAIAAGVVVGVVGFAALIGAAFLFYRHKKNKREGEFGNSAGDYDSRAPPMTDSRFDGTFMAQRRQSNGSIDENHDFSRRILQVSNPDHY